MASAHYRRLLTISIAAAMLLLLSTSLFLLHIHNTLSETSRSVADAHRFLFTFAPLSMPPNPGFEPIAAPASFTSAAPLDGHIFLSGPNALNIYSASGSLQRSLHVGLDLPPAPLGRMITAHLRGQSQPQLLIATAGAGILFFDPSTQAFRQLLPQSTGLRDSTALAALDSGELLIGTRRNGVLVSTGGTDAKALQLFRPEYANVNITALLAVGNDIWAGTQDHGILHTHAGITDRFESQLPDPHIEALAASGARVFAATPLGIAFFEDGRPSRTLASDTFAHALFADPKSLILASLTGNVLTIPLDNARPHAAFASDPDAQPTEQFLTLPGSDDLYAVRHNGLYRRIGTRWSAALEPAKAALTDNNIAALGFAPDGRLWIGYFDRGLDILDASLATAQHLEDDHLFCINRIARDPRRNTMSVATANGLVLFDATGKPRQVLTRRDGLISDHVNDVVYTGDRMTIATPAGLTFIDSTGVQSLYAFQGLVNNHVYALAASADGTELLAGTLGGVSMLRHDAVQRNLTVSNSGLRHNWVTAALPLDDQGSYMVGTYGAGVMRLDRTGHFTSMDTVTREMVINPNAILATPTHVLAGSLGQGLWSYSRASERWTQVTSGLPSLNVTAFAARDGELYVGTQNGLVRIPESNLPQ
jgi:ligand-binding sensor domain-containing protein